jgi:hypothetical protein
MSENQPVLGRRGSPAIVASVNLPTNHNPAAGAALLALMQCSLLVLSAIADNPISPGRKKEGFRDAGGRYPALFNGLRGAMFAE